MEAVSETSPRYFIVEFAITRFGVSDAPVEPLAGCWSAGAVAFRVEPSVAAAAVSLDTAGLGDTGVAAFSPHATATAVTATAPNRRSFFFMQSLRNRKTGRRGFAPDSCMIPQRADF
jgi:hypothetical protein